MGLMCATLRNSEVRVMKRLPFRINSWTAIAKATNKPRQEPGRQCAFTAALFVVATLVGGCKEPQAGSATAVADEGVYGLIQILRPPPASVGIFASSATPTPADFEMIQRTQMALIKTHSVLRPACKREETLELISQQKDPVAWLLEHLRVEQFGSPQLIRVSLAGGDQKSQVRIVNSVMDEYMDQIRRSEEMRLRELENELQRREMTIAHKTAAYRERSRNDRFGIAEEREIRSEARKAYENKLRAVQLEKVAIDTRLASTGDKNTDAEAEKNLKQLRMQARSLEAQAKWLQEQIVGTSGIQLEGIDLRLMRDQLATEEQVAKRLRICREQAGVELDDNLRWITIRQKAE
jgi:hypothetical protein